MRRLKMKLNGDIQNMDARALTEALSSVITMLKSVSEKDDGQLVMLDNLQVSSAAVTVRATDEAIQTLERGVKSLREKAEIPEGWNEATLTSVQALAKTQRRMGVESVQLDLIGMTVAIDRVLAEHAREAEGSGLKSLGSASGRLYRYFNRDSPEASLEDDQTGKAIKLVLEENRRNQVIALMDKPVVAWGILTRDIWDNRILEIKVQGIEENPSPRTIRPPSHEGRGILGPDWLNGEEPTEWVRRLRDEA